MKSNNHWRTYMNAPVVWHIEFPPQLWQRWPELLAFADTVFELGRREGVLQVDEVPPAPALFAGAVPMARISVFAAAGIEHRTVRDLGAELLALRPELSHVPHVPALSISGPQSMDQTQPVYVTISLDSDIWFAWVVGIDDDLDDGPYDNSQLAGQHTQRLNRFLAGVRDAADALGGRWSCEVSNRRYEDQIAEAGIILEQTVTVARLARWGDRICTAWSTDAAGVVRELGIPGAMVTRFNTLYVEPPPLGTIELQSIERDGVFARLDMQFSDTTLAHAELEARFGPGRGGPRVNPDSYFVLTYRIDIAGEPYACEIVAEFAHEPAGDTPVSGISLRRQPSAGQPRRAS